MFAHESWYRERAEPEARHEGVLAPRRHVTGPGDRGGLDFVLRGATGEVLVYSEGIADRLAPLVGRTIVVHGKLVEVDGALELWIGRLETG